jgi:hypothetical protein
MTKRTESKFTTLNMLDPETLPDGFEDWTGEQQDAYVHVRRAEILAFARLPHAAQQLLYEFAQRLLALGAVDDARPPEQLLGADYGAWEARFRAIGRAQFADFFAAQQSVADLLASVAGRDVLR